jgi:hypothetical protein
MNVERCVALHNEILQYGWYKSGRSAEDFDPKCKTWIDTFDSVSEHFQDALNHLSLDLVRFLRRARVPVEYNLEFFYWIQGLSSPDFMVEMSEHFKYRGNMDESIGDEVLWNNRYFLLYPMNNFHGHFMSLV